MHRLLSTLLAAFVALLALLPGAAAGADGTTILGRAELEKVFTDLVLGRTTLPPGDLTISRFTATPGAVAVPPGPREFRIVSRGQAKEATGRQTIVADLLVNGAGQARVTLSGDLALRGEVVCAARTLSRHRLLAAGDLTKVRRDLTALGPDLVTDLDLALGRELMTTLQPGTPLYSRFLKEPALVKRGDIVAIKAASGPLTVMVPGRAQGPGARGDLIKVKNLMSRKEILAKVIDPDTVQVDL